LTTKERTAQKDFYNAKSSIPDEIALIRKKPQKKTVPLQITHNEEDPSNQNHELVPNFAARWRAI
jgi:hypothetical protein